MSSSLLNKAGRKLFERNLEQYAPADPLYEQYTDAKGKQRRRRKDIPPGLSKRDAKILRSVQRRAHYLDKGFQFCGLRFGWTFIIGIIPGAGDVADASLNYFLVVRKARKAEIPSWLLRRMLVNNAVSAAVGLIPIAGDLVLAAYKANSRNAALLEEFLRIRGEEFIKLGVDGSAAAAKGKKNGKGKGDAKQLKPGAGVPKVENAIEAERSSGNPKAGTLTSTETPAPGVASTPSPRRKSFGKGFSSFFAKKAPGAGEKGRFVENIGEHNINTKSV